MSIKGLEKFDKFRKPIYRHLYRHCRELILTNQWKAGQKIPSSRSMSDLLGVSRNTVIKAFEQLLDEGYVLTTHGSGTRVSELLPENALFSRPARHHLSRKRKPENTESNSRPHRTRVIKAKAFVSNTPDIETFPYATWGKLVSRCWRLHGKEIVSQGYPFTSMSGYPPLLDAIAAHVGATRGSYINADQVIITLGNSHSIRIITQTLLNSDDEVWVEDPGFQTATREMIKLKAKIRPIPVESDGLDLAYAIRRYPRAKLAYLTPSHQCPTGVELSLKKRLEILDWATRRKAWIIEDDYDSDFHFHGRPLSSLHAIDEKQCVLYLGSFSLTLFPNLRVGFIIAPTKLKDRLLSTRGMMPPAFEQIVLSHFMSEGHYLRHIKKMRTRYKNKFEYLFIKASEIMGKKITLPDTAMGVNVLGELSGNTRERDIVAMATTKGLMLRPLSQYCIENRSRKGIVMGFSGLSPQEILRGLRVLNDIIP